MREQDLLVFKYSEIKEQGGLSVRLTPSPALFSDVFERPGALKKLELDLAFSVGGDSILLEGKVRAELDLECSRCGDSLTRSFEDSFDEVYPDSLEYVDAREVIRETSALLAPIKVLCSESCKGRCPLCGANRNRVSCGCKLDIPGQFAALKGLELKKPEKPGK